MYYCTKCKKQHGETSRQGKAHMKYKDKQGNPLTYYCTKCKKRHRKTSRQGKAHMKYEQEKKENPIPLVLAPMAIDVGKEYVKDPKLLFKPTGAIRAVGRSFGFGKSEPAIENPPLSDFEKTYGKRVYPQIKVITTGEGDYNPTSLTYYRFTKDEPNVSIIYVEEIPNHKSQQIYFIIDGTTYMAELREGRLLYLLNPESREVLSRIDRDNFSWILYPPSGEVKKYSPLVPDEVPPEFDKFEYEEEELEVDWNPPKRNSIGSIVRAARPLVKKAVPYIKKAAPHIKRGAKYVAEHPEAIVATGQAVGLARGVQQEIEPRRPVQPQPEPYPAQPYPAQPYPAQPYPAQPQPQPQYPPYYYPYPQNPKRNPKKIDDLEELYNFIGGA